MGVYFLRRAFGLLKKDFQKLYSSVFLIQKRSIFSRIFTGYLLIVFVLSGLILVFSFKTIKDHYIDTFTGNLKNLGIILNLKITPLLEENRRGELDSFVKKLGKEINTRITVIAPDGKVYADSEKDPASMENHRGRPEVIQALECGVGRSLRYSSTVKEEMLYVAMPVEKEGKIIGVVRVSIFLKQIKVLLQDLRRRILEVAFLAMIVSLLGAALFSRSLSRPVRDLARASHRVASGDFNVRVFLKSEDELGDLAESFNYMTEKIKTLFADLSLQKEELDSIIFSIQEGLLVLDSEGKIVLSNESFRRIIQEDTIEGKFYWEVVRESRLGELVEKVRNMKKNLTGEVELNGRNYLCSATFLSFREGIIVILHDITEFKRLEKIKKDFVVNVSHELRTPLTAIKGFVETLGEEIDQKQKHYLEVIKKHTDRLINIVQDLLLLARLEKKKVELEWEEVNLKNLIEEMVRIFEERIREKNLALKLNIEGDVGSIKGDAFKLEQMFINLIDNAVKYTEKGEIKISLQRKNQQVRIEIQDTGIGIPTEHLERIFERFYVVDKSRSRKLGGTGLGLAIVKHIVLLHNGEINVESTPGVGSKFIVFLPANFS